MRRPGVVLCCLLWSSAARAQPTEDVEQDSDVKKPIGLPYGAWASAGTDSRAPHIGLSAGAEGRSPGLGCAGLDGFAYAGVDEQQVYFANAVTACPWRSGLFDINLKQSYERQARPGLFHSYRGPRAPMTTFGWGFDVVTASFGPHEALIWSVSSVQASFEGRETESLFTAEVALYRLELPIEVKVGTVSVSGAELQRDLVTTRVTPASVGTVVGRDWSLRGELSIVHAGNWLVDDDGMALPSFTAPSYGFDAKHVRGFEAHLRRQLEPTPGNALLLEDRLDVSQDQPVAAATVTVRGYGARNHVWTARGDNLQFVTGGLGLAVRYPLHEAVMIEAGGEVARSMYGELDGELLALPEVAGRVFLGITASYGSIRSANTVRNRWR